MKSSLRLIAGSAALAIRFTTASFSYASPETGGLPPAPKLVPPSCSDLPAKSLTPASMPDIQIFTAMSFTASAPEVTFEGTMQIGGTSEEQNYPATLISGDGKRIHLEVSSPVPRSLRILGDKAETKTVKGTTSLNGLEPFGAPIVTGGVLRRLIQDSTMAFYDRGSLTVEGMPLDRITVRANDPSHGGLARCGDLYFTRATGALVFSVLQRTFGSMPVYSYTQIVHYENYQRAADITVPYRITEFNNGTFGFAFSVHSATTGAASDDSSYTF